MSRQPRKISQTGIYHVMFRGINRQNIFEEEKDYYKLFELIFDLKTEMNFILYAYCFMSNHVHMLLREIASGDITAIMHKLLTSYAGWYNKKYSRSGSLFWNRFASEPVEKERYLFTLVRYIHQNPRKAGIVEHLSDYKWSSYNEYFGTRENLPDIIDANYILGFISKDKNKARDVFLRLNDDLLDEDFEIGYSRKKSDSQIRKRIMELLNGKEPHTLGTLPKAERNALIVELRRKEGFTIREIERATGISRGIISRVSR